MLNYYENILCKIKKYFSIYNGQYSKINRHLIFFVFNNWFGGKTRFKRSGEKINVSFVLSGGLGDIIIAGIYINKFIKKVDCPVNVNIFVWQPVDCVKALFGSYPSMQNVFYMKKLKAVPSDIVIKFNVQFPEILFFRESYISKKSSFIRNYCKEITKFNEKYKEIILSGDIFKQQILSNILGVDRITGMDVLGLVGLKSDESFEINVNKEWKNILKTYSLNKQKFITFSYSVDINNLGGSSIRLWPVEYFNSLIKRIKRDFPDVKVVQLGAKSLAEIEGVDVNLVGKTSFGELLALLDASLLHIDGECGMVHLRHFVSGKPSLVLFGPTSPSTKSYKENINIRAKVCNCDNCEWLMGENWQTICAKTGEEKPACLLSIKPDYALEKIKRVLKNV